MSAADVPLPGAGSVGARAARAKMPAYNYISWIALAMMTTSSVASLRAAPTMAVYGLACVFLYIVPAIVFLLPTSLVSAELASGYEGGIYKWVSQGISKPMGFLAVWCQFAMTIFYYPSLLGFVASTLAYVINPELASSGVWTALVIVVVYWTGVWVSSRGTSGVAGLASMGLVIGTLIPGVVLVTLGALFLGQGNPSAAPMDAKPSAACLGRALQPGADRQQLPVLLGHGDERRARRFLEGPRQGVPQVDVPGHGHGAADLHPSRARDQLGGPGRPALPDGRCDAGLRRGLRRVRHAVADTDRRDHARGCVLGRMLTWPPVRPRAAAHVPRRGLPPTVPAAAEQERRAAEHPVTQGLVPRSSPSHMRYPRRLQRLLVFSVITTQVYLIMYLLMFVAAVRLRRNDPDHPPATGRRCWSACAAPASPPAWRPC